MDEIYERLNPRIPIEYVLFSFLALSIVIVLGDANDEMGTG